ncbi:MAG: hypothetical protein KGQ52_01060, partial [Alphaproteobacteria bacterium]|nr:hypothetical protein [Alphaproteobacteria bacterium]
GAALLLVTGKGGRYRYLTCSTKRTMSSTACVLRNFRLAEVDDAVVTALEQKILQPERLHLLLAGLLEKSDEAAAERRQRLSRLRSALTESKGALARIWDAIEAGAASPHDPDIRARLDARNREIRSVEEQIRTVQAHDEDAQKPVITEEVLGRFASLMREGLRSDNPTLRKGYLQMLASEVRLSNTDLIIRGAKGNLETVIAKTAGDRGQLVPTFAGNWRTRQDSNL